MILAPDVDSLDSVAAAALALLPAGPPGRTGRIEDAAGHALRRSEGTDQLACFERLDRGPAVARVSVAFFHGWYLEHT